jgi:hypothetical protein
MRQYIYKVLITLIAIIVIYEFTIGKAINKFNQKIEIVFSKEGRKNLVKNIKKEMQKGVSKENYLSDEERILINKFMNKIQNELKSVDN